MKKCRYGDEPATKRVIWADGRAAIYVCDKHVATAKEQIEDENHDDVVAVEPLTAEEKPEEDAKKALSWPEFKLITPGGRVGSDRRTGSSANRENWVEKTPAGELPQYIRIVRNGLMREGHSEGRATALAVAAIERWKDGGDNVSPKVQAAAAKAWAEWEAMKASKAAPSPLLMASLRSRREWISEKAKKKPKDDEEYSARENLVRGENEIERQSGKDPNRVSRRGTDPSKGKDEEGGKGKARRVASAAGERRYGKPIGSLIGGTGDKDTEADKDARIAEAADLEAALKKMVPMKQGAKGVEVRYLQDMLEKGGYGKFVLDGVYGPKTVAAVKKAQKDLGLEETGVVDDKLLSKLTKEHSLVGDKPSGNTEEGAGQATSDALNGEGGDSDTAPPKVSKARIARARKEAEKDEENVLSTEDPKDVAKLRGYLRQAGYEMEDDWEVRDLEFQEILKSIQQAAGLPEDGSPDALLVQLIRNAIGEQKDIGSVYDLIGNNETEQAEAKDDSLMGIEHKTVGVSGLKVLDAEEGLVETYVSVTGIVDNVKDIIEPGAYEKTLVARTPKGVWHHSWEVPVSRTEDVKELMPGDPELPKFLPGPEKKAWPAEAGALKVITKFNLDTQPGREAYSNVLFFGDQQEWSIGYNVPTGGSVMDKSLGVRRIKALDLYEYSPVLFGAMPAARTKTVADAQLAFKSLMGEDITNFEQGLKELKAAAGQQEAMGVVEEEKNDSGNEKDEGYGKCKKCGAALDPDGVCADCGPDEDQDGEEEKGLFDDLDVKDINLGAVSIDALRKLQTAIKAVLDEAMGGEEEAPQDEDDTSKKELSAASEYKSLSEAVDDANLDDDLKHDLFMSADEFDEALKKSDDAGIEAGAGDFLDGIDNALDNPDLSEDEEKSLKWLLEVMDALTKSDVVDEETDSGDQARDETSGDQEASGEKAAKGATEGDDGFVIDTKELDVLRASLL